MKIFVKNKGSLYTLKNGEPKAIEFIDARADDCDLGFNSCDRSIEFKHSTKGQVSIPLDALYDFLDDNAILGAPNQMTISSVVSLGQTEARVSWTEVGIDDNLAFVEIYRDAVLIATIAAGGTLDYDDSGLTAATMYTYTILGIDADGNRGPISAGVSVTTDA